MGKEHCMIVVDYIQKLAYAPAFCNGSRDLKDKIAETLNRLAGMVETVKAPVLAISSLSKPAYNRSAADLANIADFKASGELEYTGDVGFQLRFASDERGMLCFPDGPPEMPDRSGSRCSCASPNP
jgi:hypothetical protein